MKERPKKLPRNKNRTVKYTKADKASVVNLFNDGVSIHKIALYTGISRRYVQFILDPEKLKQAKELYKIRRADGRYYDKDKNREAVKKTRKHRRKLNLSNKY